jgi:AbrB family looped-hinge helix DNA binding protein
MSKITTMTSKGQVTIPKNVRDQLGLQPFDKIEIVADDEGGARLRKARPRIRELLGSLPANGLSVEEATARAEELRGKDLVADDLEGCR